MSDGYTDSQRRVLTWLLFSLLGVIILAGSIGPAYVAGRQREDLLTLQCQNARSTVMQLQATKVTLEAQAQIAGDLGLPVYTDIRAQLANFTIPEVPAECADI